MDEHKFDHFTKQSELLYPIYFVQNYSYFNQYCQIHNYLEFFFSKMKPVSMYLLWALLGNPGRFYPRILTMTKTPVMLLGSSLIQHPNYPYALGFQEGFAPVHEKFFSYSFTFPSNGAATNIHKFDIS